MVEEAQRKCDLPTPVDMLGVDPGGRNEIRAAPKFPP